jgi:hypothetical protein
MKKNSLLSSVIKWIAGIAAAVIGAVLIAYLTGAIRPGSPLNPASPTPTIMVVSGDWLTPFDNLSYRVTQDEAHFTWLIRESGVSGEGAVKGKTFVGTISGQEVVYGVGEWAPNGDPTVLYSSNPAYLAVILFRTCADFKKFAADISSISPQLTNVVRDALKKIPNPTCPNSVP